MGREQFRQGGVFRPSRPCFVNSNVTARITWRWACALEVPAWPAATLCGSRPRAHLKGPGLPTVPGGSLGSAGAERMRHSATLAGRGDEGTAPVAPPAPSAPCPPRGQGQRAASAPQHSSVPAWKIPWTEAGCRPWSCSARHS